MSDSHGASGPSARGIDRYALFGHPVSHSRSAFIHGRFAAQEGRPLEFSLIDVEPADFERAARAFFAGGGRGANVTVPHKEAAAVLADELTPRAARAGAVNTLAPSAHGLLGDNTDGAGLIRDLRGNVGLELRGSRILLLGAGGAARGVLGPLLDEMPAIVWIANRNAGRAHALAARFEDAGPVRASGLAQIAPGAFDLVINATSASLAGEVPPLPDHCYDPRTVAYDMAYASVDTPFLRDAAARGARQTWLGWGMLVEQAAEAYRVWRGVSPDTRPVLAELRERGNAGQAVSGNRP